MVENRPFCGGSQSRIFTPCAQLPMPVSTEITGKEIKRIFKQLLKEDTLLRVTLLEGDGDGVLTTITGIAKGKSKSYFRIDATADFGKRVDTDSNGKLLFEYDGDNGIPYFFRCSRAKIRKAGFWLRFPEMIEKIQRRKHFRLKHPPSTTVSLVIEGKTYEAEVIDISIGGILITQTSSFQEKTNLCVGDCLNNVCIIFPEDTERMKLGVSSAEIKRIVDKDGGNGYDYAIEFHHIGKKEREKLADFIYRCQRDKLKLHRIKKQD